MVVLHQHKSSAIDAHVSTPSSDTGSLNDVSGPRASQARDQLRSAIHDKAQAPSQSSGITDASIETSLSALTQQQAQFHKRVLTPAQSLVEGAQSNVETGRREVAESGIVARLLGHRAALKEGLAISERDVSNQTAHAEKLKARYEASLESKRAAEEMLVTAKRVADQGFTEEAAAMRVGASKLISQANDSLKGLKAIDPQHVAETVAGMRELQKRLDGVIQRAEYGQTAASIVKETAHVAGIGVGFALGGPAGGAAVNQGLRMIEGAAEEGMHVVLGNKTRKEAGSEFLKRSQDALVESAITGASGAVGQRVGAFAAKLHGPVVAKTVDILSSGTIQSAGTGVQIGYEFGKAHQEFEKNNPALEGPARERAYTEFMNSHGFSLEEVCKRLGASFAAGAAAKGVFHVVAQGAAPSQGVRVTLANSAENTTSNVGEVTVQGGPITLETVVPALLGGHIVQSGVRQAQGGNSNGQDRTAVNSARTPQQLAVHMSHEVSVNGVQGAIRVSPQQSSNSVEATSPTGESGGGPTTSAVREPHEQRPPAASASRENKPQTVPEQLRASRDEVARIHDQIVASGILSARQRNHLEPLTTQPTTREPGDLLSEYKSPVMVAERAGIEAAVGRIEQLRDSLRAPGDESRSVESLKKILRDAIAYLPKAQEAEHAIERQVQLRAQHAAAVEAKKSEVLQATGFNSESALYREKRAQYAVHRAHRGVFGYKALLKSTTAGKALSRIETLEGISGQLLAVESLPYHSVEHSRPVSSLQDVFREAAGSLLSKLQKTGDSVARASLNGPHPASAEISKERLATIREEYMTKRFTEPFDTALAATALSADEKTQLRDQALSIARLCFDHNVNLGSSHDEICPVRAVLAFEARLSASNLTLGQRLKAWIGEKPWTFEDATKTSMALCVSAQARDEVMRIAGEHKELSRALQGCAAVAGTHVSSDHWGLPAQLHQQGKLFGDHKAVEPDVMRHVLTSAAFRDAAGVQGIELTSKHLDDHLLTVCLANNTDGQQALLGIQDVRHLPAVLALTYVRPGGRDGPFVRPDADGVPHIRALAARFHTSSEAMEQLRQIPGAAELTQIFATCPEAIALAVAPHRQPPNEETGLNARAIRNHLTELTCHLIQHGTREDLARTVHAACESQVVSQGDVDLAIIRRFDRMASEEERAAIVDLCRTHFASSDGKHLGGAFEYVASQAMELGIHHKPADVSKLLFWRAGRHELPEEVVTTLAGAYDTSSEQIRKAHECLRALEARAKQGGVALFPSSKLDEALRQFLACSANEGSRSNLLLLADASVHLPFSGSSTIESVTKLIHHAPQISDAVQAIRAVNPEYRYTVYTDRDAHKSPYKLDALTMLRLIQTAHQSPPRTPSEDIVALVSRVLSVRGSLGEVSAPCRADSARRFVEACRRLQGGQVETFADVTQVSLTRLAASRAVDITPDEFAARAEAAALVLPEPGGISDRMSKDSISSGLGLIMRGTPDQIRALADGGYSDHALFNLLPKVAAVDNEADFAVMLARAHLLDTLGHYCNSQAAKDQQSSGSDAVVDALVRVEPAVLREIVAAQYPTDFLREGLVPLASAPQGESVVEQVVRAVSAQSPLSNDWNFRSYFVDAMCDSTVGAREVVAAFLRISEQKEKLPREGTRVVNLLLLANAAWSEKLSQRLAALPVSDREAFGAIEEVVRNQAHTVLSDRYSSELLEQMQRRDPVRLAQFAEVLLTYEVSLHKFNCAEKVPALRVLATVEMLGAESQLRNRDPEFLKTFQENIATYVPIEAERDGALSYLKRCYEDSTPSLLLPAKEYASDARAQILSTWNDRSLTFKHMTSEVDGVDRGYAIVREVSQICIPGHISPGLKEAIGANPTDARLLGNPSEQLGNEVKSLITYKRLLGGKPIDIGELAQQGEIGRRHVERLSRSSSGNQEETIASLQREIDTKLDELKREQKARNQYSELRRLLGSQEQLQRSLEDLDAQVKQVAQQQRVVLGFDESTDTERRLRSRGGAVLAREAVSKVLTRTDLSDPEKKALEALSIECSKLVDAHDKVTGVIGMQVKSVVALRKVLRARTAALEEISQEAIATSDIPAITEPLQARDPLLAWQITEALRLAPDEQTRKERVSSLLQAAWETTLTSDLERLEVALKSTQKELSMELTFQPEHRATGILTALVNQCLDYRSKKSSVGNTVYNMALVDPLKEVVVAYDSDGVARVNGELYVGRTRCNGVEGAALVLDTVWTPDKSLVTESKLVGYLGYCLEKAERLGLPVVVPYPALQDVFAKLSNQGSNWSATHAELLEVLIPGSPSGGFYVETKGHRHYNKPTWIEIGNAMILARADGLTIPAAAAP